MRKIYLLLPEYYYTVHVTKHSTQNNEDKPMTTIPDLGQAHDACGGVELV